MPSAIEQAIRWTSMFRATWPILEEEGWKMKTLLGQKVFVAPGVKFSTFELDKNVFTTRKDLFFQALEWFKSPAFVSSAFWDRVWDILYDSNCVMTLSIREKLVFVAPAVKVPELLVVNVTMFQTKRKAILELFSIDYEDIQEASDEEAAPSAQKQLQNSHKLSVKQVPHRSDSGRSTHGKEKRVESPESPVCGHEDSDEERQEDVVLVEPEQSLSPSLAPTPPKSSPKQKRVYSCEDVNTTGRRNQQKIGLRPRGLRFPIYDENSSDDEGAGVDENDNSNESLNTDGEDTCLESRHPPKLRCNMPGCVNKKQHFGLCKKHGGRRMCRIPKCTRQAIKKWLCKRHYDEYMATPNSLS